MSLKIAYRPISDLIPYARNSRTHSDEQVAQIAASIREFGWTNPVLIDGKNGIIAGHGRVLAAQRLGMSEVPTILLDHMTDAQRRAYVIADNKLALNAGWDADLLKIELGDLNDDGFDLSLIGFSPDEISNILDGDEEEAGDGAADGKQHGSLAEKFLIPPFSVFNAREGWWQERKRSWLALGIQSELGRDGQLISNGGGANSKSRYDGKDAEATGTSVFDPVVCEIVYRWFCPPGGTVLDPFAGGSVRGVVASKLGRQYVGIELREEQVAANRGQGDEICSDPVPVWHIGDSREIGKYAKGVKADLVFSCPPYADLERYSDDERDLSTLGYAEFRDAYREIIKEACALLKQDGFAVFVVGEVRDKKGSYYGFVPDTIEAFLDAGLKFYNEAILVTSVGSLPIRAAKAFEGSRKLGKTHQNILVFVKGDAKKATQAIGAVECGEMIVEEGAEDLGEPL